MSTCEVLYYSDMNIKKAIEAINIDVENISDPNLKTIVLSLLNIIEALSMENKEVMK